MISIKDKKFLLKKRLLILYNKLYAMNEMLPEDKYGKYIQSILEQEYDAINENIKHAELMLEKLDMIK